MTHTLPPIKKRRPTGTTHKQVKASRAWVDEGLAELLAHLWTAGIHTNFSCQGGDRDSLHPKGHDATILFPTVDDALRFMHGTFDRTGWWGCYTAELVMKLAGPLSPPPRPEMGRSPFYDPDENIRATVKWPATMTATWTAAWCDPEVFQKAFQASMTDRTGPYYA